MIGRLDGVGVAAEYEKRVYTLNIYAKLNGADTANDVLARAASRGRYGARELIQVVKNLQAAGRTAELKAFVRSMVRTPYLNLASLLANQARRPTDAHDATEMMLALVRHHFGDPLGELDKQLLLGLLADQGREAELEECLARFGTSRRDLAQTALLRANAIHPFSGGRDGPSERAVEEWLAVVNQMYLAAGLEPIAFASGRQDPLDRMLCAPTTMVEDGPLVTVIVPTYRPGPRIATALMSLVAQSYRNLQILVMDDASPDNAARSLQRWGELDPRIQVLRLPENGGTYRARNIAVANYARGRYITVHDDDDWSHPRKLELQVAHLEAEPDIKANMSLLVRATPDLRFTRINDNPYLTQRNYSSLMIRREVFETLGYWDVVNRSADAEMHDRIKAWSGTPAPGVGTVPTSFLRVREASLTSGEINRGYLDPRRRWYAMSYQQWHARQKSEGWTQVLPPAGMIPRPFPAPFDMVRPPAVRSTARVDVLYGTDFRFPGGNSTLTCNELEILLAEGFTVGMLQIDSPILSPSNPIHPRAVRAASHPNARVLTLRDSVEADLTIVRHPTVMQYLPGLRANVETGHLVLIVNHAPFFVDGTGSHYDICDVVSTCGRVFGRVPEVAPESPLIRGLLKGLVEPKMLAQRDWTGVIPQSAPAPRTASPGRPPVLGRHSRDQPAKWPVATDLELVYPTDGSREVRILGGADGAARRLGRPVPANWAVHPFGGASVEEFLSGLDFWAYFHGPDLHESFGMATLEALAAGLVVILPYYMEPRFGEGALYCAPAEVRQVIDRLWGAPEEYRRQSERALRIAEERFGRSALLERVSPYVRREALTTA